MKRFGNLAGVLNASPRELRAIAGIGETAVVAIKCARAAALRMAREEILNRPVLGSWQKVLDYCRAALAHEKTERLHLLFLDRKNTLIADEVHQRGTVDHTPVYPREVVKRALELEASAIILVHNHPSGDPTPSRDDVEITRAIVEAAEPLGVSVHDHLIIGHAAHASLKSMGLM